MKLFSRTNDQTAIGMTEWLIVVAVLALGCILIFSQFGRQAKGVCINESLTIAGRKPMPVTATVPDTRLTTMSSFSPYSGGQTAAAGPKGGGSSTSTAAESGAVTDELAHEFINKVAEQFAHSAERTVEDLVQAIKAAGQQMHLSKEQFREMLEKAKSSFAVNGELASTGTMESLQQAASNVQRESAALADAMNELPRAEFLEEAGKIFTAGAVIDDSLQIISEGIKSETDPEHKHEHDGNLVGIAIGGVAGAGIAALGAPILLGAGLAVIIGLGSKSLLGWLGSKADQAAKARNGSKAPTGGPYI